MKTSVQGGGLLGRSIRSTRWDTRHTIGAFLFLGFFLLYTSLVGVVATWHVAAALKTGVMVVTWHDSPDLVAMAAPLLVSTAVFVWPGRITNHPDVIGNHPLLCLCAFAALTVLTGVGLGKGDAWLLGRFASANGYHRCATLNVMDSFGKRSLRSWGYSRAACLAREPTIRTPPA